MKKNSPIIIKDGFDNKIVKLRYSVPIAKDGNIVEWVNFDTKEEADNYSKNIQANVKQMTNLDIHIEKEKISDLEQRIAFEKMKK